MPACPNCGHENTAEARFCNNCGAALAQAPAPAAEERKVVTVLFADVTGSTALGERLDAEELKDVMATFFAAMRAEIEAEGGIVDKFIGDAVMAVFGVPRVHEDDPARALRAALRMRAQLGTLNERLSERHGVTIEMRIGINTGPVLAVNDAQPDEGIITGDTVNVAARVESSAEPGHVLVAERTANSARGFRFSTPPQSLEIRGRTEPIRVVELVAAQAISEGALSGLRASFVGRTHELDLLTTTYRRVAEEGRPHLVTVYGDAGVGKSRLIAELLAGLEWTDYPPRVLRGRCLAYGDGISYWPLAEMLKAHAGVLDTDSVTTARERVTAVAATTLEAAGVDAPHRTASILEVSIGLAPLDRNESSPHELRADTQLAWRSFFSSLATESPAIVVVEDLQWADAAVLEVLEDVTARANGPLLILTTARPELTDRRPNWGGGRLRFTGLVVEPLAPEESKRLVDLLVDPDTGGGERREMLARGEGNPFFLEEIVRTRALGSAHAIPDTVQAALAARIDLLQRDEKRLLQAAAVVGRVFWPAAVAEVASLDPTTRRRAARRPPGPRPRPRPPRLLNERPARDDLQARAHPRRRLRIPPPPRARAHAHRRRRLDRARLRRPPRRGRRADRAPPPGRPRGRPDPGAPGRRVRSRRRRGRERLRARGLRAGRSPSRARRSSSRARRSTGRARSRRSATSRSCASTAPPPGSRCARPPTSCARETPEDRQRLARICGFGVMIPARAQGLLRFAITAEEVRPYLDLGLEAAGEEPSEALALLCVAQGLWDFGFGIDPEDPDGVRAQRAAERARELARQLGRPDLELMSLDALTAGWQMRGLYGLAEAANRERLAIARTVSDPFEVSDTYYTAAWAQLDIGRFEDVIALTDEFIARDTDVEPIGQLSLSAVARLALGDWDGALADQARVRELIGEEAAAPRFSTSGYGVETLIYEARGDSAAADAVLAEIGAGMEATKSTRDWSLPQAAMALGAPRRLRRGGEHARARLRARRLSPARARGALRARGRAGRVGRGPGPCRAGAPPRRGRRPARAPAARRPAGGARAAGDRRRGGRGGVPRPGRARGTPSWRRPGRSRSRSSTWARRSRPSAATTRRARCSRSAAAVFERLGVPRELERARALLRPTERTSG